MPIWTSKMPLTRWLGSLLSPAEDPRPGLPAGSSVEALLDDLRRSRTELAQFRANLDPHSPVAKQLESEEAALVDAEQNLRQSMNEQRARAALVRARRHATEAELLSDL